MARKGKARWWEEYGTGHGTVYLYYYPSQKAHAQMTGQPVWKCKIGQTKEPDVVDYIDTTKVNKDRVIFDIPQDEYPDIPLLFKTDNPKGLEKQIHNILKTLDRWIKIKGANEWYFTNPKEVKQIYLFLMDFDVFR